jgi:hypothetical protein
VRVGPIRLVWEDDRRLRVQTVDGASVDWSIEIGSTWMTHVMSLVGSALPLAVWRSQPFLRVMGRVAGWSLRAGTVRLTGLTSNAQRFAANPLRVWYVTGSRALVEGEDLGPIGPLAEQAHLNDFYIPQRGVFAVGRVFVTPRSTPQVSHA